MARPPVDPCPRFLVYFALDRAVEHRRRLHRADLRFAHYAGAALVEQVVGVSTVAHHAGEGWWAIGVISDGPTGHRLRVWLHPRRRLVRVERTERRPPSQPPPVEKPVYRALDHRWHVRSGWIHRFAGQPLCADCANAALNWGTSPEAMDSTPLAEPAPVVCHACDDPIA